MSEYLGVHRKGANKEDIENLSIDINANEQNIDDNFNAITVLSDETVKRIDNIQIKTSWANSKDDGAVNPKRRYSARIDGNVNLLSLTFQDFSPLNLESTRGVLKYYLLIDRFRNQEFKGSGKEYRKAGYKHEVIDEKSSTNKINTVLIDSPNMILDFNQDYYFKQYNGIYTDKVTFPAPTGVSTGRNQMGYTNRLTNNVRKGFVDLAFRIRVDSKGRILHETPYLGFIRMLATNDKILDRRLITYVNRQY
ncbi:hypothetical protein [Mangrovimonas cancribranchiae]|uniref:Uncharacterized protein n=1 Tax=Mangrovimonas cancribranchiae TaxID=3080055 RepID=A0AAU6NX30_9FLAO